MAFREKTQAQKRQIGMSGFPLSCRSSTRLATKVYKPLCFPKRVLDPVLEVC